MSKLSELKAANRTACDRMNSIMADSHGRSMTPVEREAFDKATAEAEDTGAEIDRLTASGHVDAGTQGGPRDDQSGYLAAYLAARADAVSGKGASREAAVANMRAQLAANGLTPVVDPGAGLSPARASMARIIAQSGR